MKESIQPTWCGDAFYPWGLPVKPGDYSYESQTISDIFLKHCVKKTSEEEEKILCGFVIYYINAPMFDNELTQEVKDKDLAAMNLDQLIEECLNIGLDPF